MFSFFTKKSSHQIPTLSSLSEAQQQRQQPEQQRSNPDEHHNVRSSSLSTEPSSGQPSVSNNSEATKPSIAGLRWGNIVAYGKGENVEAFLLQADIGSVIMKLDPGIIKNALFGSMAKFEKFPTLQLRAIQLLQDCHMLTPGGVGITNIELGQRFEVLLRVLSSWLNKADIVITMFELLAMVADREVMKERCGSVANSELLQFMARALEIHSNTKEVQRAGLMLYECILQHATDRSRRVFAEKMFRAVLDNLLLNNDDPFICYASFSILDALAGTVNKSLLKPFTDQLINLTLSCIASLHSSSVVCKCLEFLEKLTEDPSTLSAVAGHNRGLWIFVDAVGILQAEEIGACISCLEMMQKIVQDKELLRIALENIDNQGESRVEHVVEVEAEFRKVCSKFYSQITDYDRPLDEFAVEYWIRLSELVIALLVELPTQREHHEAADRVAQKKLATSGGIGYVKDDNLAVTVEAVPVDGKLSSAIPSASVDVTAALASISSQKSRAARRKQEQLVSMMPLYAIVEETDQTIQDDVKTVSPHPQYSSRPMQRPGTSVASATSTAGSHQASYGQSPATHLESYRIKPVLKPLQQTPQYLQPNLYQAL